MDNKFFKSLNDDITVHEEGITHNMNFFIVMSYVVGILTTIASIIVFIMGMGGLMTAKKEAGFLLICAICTFISGLIVRNIYIWMAYMLYTNANKTKEK